MNAAVQPVYEGQNAKSFATGVRLSYFDVRNLKVKKGEDAPVAWTRTEGRGKVFYTSLGHREDVWTNPVWQKHLLGGIAWALGQEK